MANIFEELMQSHAKLTESLKPSKPQSRCNCKKFSCKKFRLESLRIFEDVDLDELDAEFDVDPEEASEDEVVLIIDPELPTDEEVPEEAAENIVGDLVYKCPVCGANYVCDPENENEFLSVDEEGVPTECPVCGDDSEQILVGEIAPADSVNPEDEQEMEPVEAEDEEGETEESEGGEEEVEEETEEEETYEEESLKRRKSVTEGKIQTTEVDNQDSSFAAELTGKELFKSPKADKKSYLGTVNKVEKKKGNYYIYLAQKEEPIEVASNVVQKFYVADSSNKLAKKVGKDKSYDSSGQSTRDYKEKDKRLAASYQGRRRKDESVEVEVKVDDDDPVEIKAEVDDRVDTGIEDTFETEFEVESKKSPARDKKTLKKNKSDDEVEEGCNRKKVKESELGNDLSRYQKWVDYDMKRYKKISDKTKGFLDKAGLEVVKDDHGDYEVIAKSKKESCKSKTESKVRKPITKTVGTRRPGVSESRINRSRAVQEAKATRTSTAKKTANRPYTFKETKFESLMTKMIRENYKTDKSFKVTRAYLSDGKLNLNYTVGNKKGTFVAEGFDKKATKMKLRIKDKGVFTESFTKVPSFIVECVCVNKSVIPMRIRYNYTKQVKEQLYRVRGEVK